MGEHDRIRLHPETVAYFFQSFGLLPTIPRIPHLHEVINLVRVTFRTTGDRSRLRGATSCPPS